MKGYDTPSPGPGAEDIELSHRMSAYGCKMEFSPDATVYDSAPDTLEQYVKQGYKFALLRVLTVAKSSWNALKNRHTPQLMKLRLLFAAIPPCIAVMDFAPRPAVPSSIFIAATFFIGTLPSPSRGCVQRPVVGDSFFSTTLLEGLCTAVGCVGGSASCIPQTGRVPCQVNSLNGTGIRFAFPA